MSELIPLLWELNGSGAYRPESRPQRRFSEPDPVDGWPGVPPGFVKSFVELHLSGQAAPRRLSGGIQASRGSSRPDAAWRNAQTHWEVVVARVLDTDVVKPNASGEVAIRRAVRASALLLDRMARQGRCPICP